jgi:hypothetical protein
MVSSKRSINNKDKTTDEVPTESWRAFHQLLGPFHSNRSPGYWVGMYVILNPHIYETPDAEIFHLFHCLLLVTWRLEQ